MVLGYWDFLSSFVIQSFGLVIIIGLIGLVIGKWFSYNGEEDDL